MTAAKTGFILVRVDGRVGWGAGGGGGSVPGDGDGGDPFGAHFRLALGCSGHT